MQFGALHRVGDEPALVVRDKNTGVDVREEYYLEGKRYRILNPAVIERDSETGFVVREEFYRNDIRVDAPEESTCDPNPS